MDTLAKSAESAIVNAYNAGDKKGTFAIKVGIQSCIQLLLWIGSEHYGLTSHLVQLSLAGGPRANVEGRRYHGCHESGAGENR